MKVAAKIFLIIGMVFGFFLIFPLIIGLIAIKKIDEAKKQDDLVLWAILSIFLVSPIGGILMLFIQPEEEANNNAGTYNNFDNNNADKSFVNGQYTDHAKEFDYIQRIKRLKELLDSGAITKEEFEQLKAEELKKSK